MKKNGNVRKQRIGKVIIVIKNISPENFTKLQNFKVKL